jgi:uncharacterized protein YqgC (DUF456 family)
MKVLTQKIISIAVFAGGIITVIVGVAGLFLPIIPGFVLILAGLWMIRKVYKNPRLERLIEIVKQKIALREDEPHKRG